MKRHLARTTILLMPDGSEMRYNMCITSVEEGKISLSRFSEECEGVEYHDSEFRLTVPTGWTIEEDSNLHERQGQ